MASLQLLTLIVIFTYLPLKTGEYLGNDTDVINEFYVFIYVFQHKARCES